MEENGKAGDVHSEEQVPVNDFEKAVKDLAERRSQMFGPSDRELAARQVELQRQKVKLHREGKL
jgi:hypothetical protein